MSEPLARLPEQALDRAVAVLQGGGVVAFPTETSYGLAVDPTNPEAVGRLFLVKRRPPEKPLLLLAADGKQLAQVVTTVPKLYLPLMEAFWPGPLTLIFPARPELDQRVTGGTGTVGVRISPHPLARELARRFGRPVTATSANLSGQLPANTPAEVVAQFGANVDALLDGGVVPGGLPSTVCGLRAGKLVVVRPGRIDLTGHCAHLIGKVATGGR